MGKELGPGVGFEFPSFEVSWLKRDLLLFANSIGATYPDELHFLYVRIPFRLLLLSNHRLPSDATKHLPVRSC
jgi:hypothetical protein